MRDTCVPRDSEVVKLNSAPSGRRVFTASYSLPITAPSFPICTSFNRKLTCRLNGRACGMSAVLDGRGGWVPPPSRSTSRSRVAILASFVSRSTLTVLLEGEGTSSSCDCSTRNVSLAACSSCTGKQRSQACAADRSLARFTTHRYRHMIKTTTTCFLKEKSFY